MTNMIEKEKYYTLNEIIKKKLIPWVKSLPTLSRWVNKDIKNGGQLFKAIVRGDGIGKRYLIKGESLIEFINQADTGKLQNPITPEASSAENVSEGKVVQP